MAVAGDAGPCSWHQQVGPIGFFFSNFKAVYLEMVTSDDKVQNKKVAPSSVLYAMILMEFLS